MWKELELLTRCVWPASIAYQYVAGIEFMDVVRALQHVYKTPDYLIA